MVDQTQVKDDASPTPRGSLRADFHELIEDLLALVELQFRLLGEDTRGVVRGARTAVVMLLAAGVIAAASLPVGILGVSYLIAVSGLPLWASMLIVTFVLLGLSAVALAMGYHRFKAAVGLLHRSRRELQLNLEWIRRALRGHNGQRYP